jgi:hypothetical protein
MYQETLLLLYLNHCGRLTTEALVASGSTVTASHAG